MEERSLRLAKTDGAFFTKITNTITKMLIPTKIGINGMLVTIKRNNVIKAFNELKSTNEKKQENKDVIEKKYENTVVLYLEALDKYIMESVYKKVKNRTATPFEEEALSKYYMVVRLKDTQYLEYKYKKQQFLIELDYENLKGANKEKNLEKFKPFYAEKMNSLYKGLLKNYSIQLADKMNQEKANQEQTYNNIFQCLEEYITGVLPIKIEDGTEPAYKEIVEEYDKFNAFLAGKLDKRDTIEKRMLLLGISRKLFTHSLPLVVAEQCYEELLRETRESIINSPNRKKQEMAYRMLITLIEDYNIKLLSTKIYWEKPKDREEYKKFWEEYQKVKDDDNKKQILILKQELKKNNNGQANKLVKFYKNKLVEFGAMRKIKNSYATSTNVKLTKSKERK